MQFDIETGKSVGWRISTSGDAYGDGAHTLSDFLPVCETEVVIDMAQAFEYRDSRYLSLAFYTDEQRFISRPVMELYTWPQMELHVPVPENAAYVRMSCPTSEYGTTVTLWHAGGGGSMSEYATYQRGGELIFLPPSLKNHIGEVCTLSFWIRLGEGAVEGHRVVVYPYQDTGIVICADKLPDNPTSRMQYVTVTADWTLVEYTGLVVNLTPEYTWPDGSSSHYYRREDGQYRSYGMMYLYDQTGSQKYDVYGIALTLAGGGASMSSTGRNLATNSKAMDRRPEATTRDVAGYNGNEQLVERADGFTEVVTNGTWRGIGMYLNETLPQVGESYTFSANVRNDSDIAQGVSIFMMSWKDGTRVYPPFSAYWHDTTGGNPSIPPGGEKRIAYTFTWSQEAIDLLADGGNIRCTMQVSNSEPRAFWAPKLEYGTTATPWRPAPEDTEQPGDLVYASEGVDLGDTSGLDTRLTTAESSITQQAGQIALKASQSDLTALGTRVTTAESSIMQNADSITSLVEGLEQSSYFQQDEDGFTFAIDTAISTVAQAADNAQDSADSAATAAAAAAQAAEDASRVARDYLTFQNGELTIGTSESDIRSVLTNVKFAFKTDAGDIAYFGLNNDGIWQMHIATAFVDDMLRFGDYAWIKRDNGNMSIKWLGA